ncbi:MAG: isoleucine--tRNA ligase [Candidatus Obscuribacter sp.]|jgi:isoleucyl-tRNA synthetase|nr:isoleucine--tRNA ligase [Candidatus Obscuribacter sp.]MBP7575787.1 isoleucine--tRNA ligase [Candidatus Obscuribacter sp.]MDQ5965715.1 isoleucyl-tRNA synthetase [Cyanobacteriota bacterium erpe_2018_sw_39hr_WHONDRS-SW48-000098_B_bin.30]
MKDKAYPVNLPQTAFPMKANSAVREVEIQKGWDEAGVYKRNLEKRNACQKYVLHDGPPYLSSAKIHIGTALNKILKDIVTKYKALKGFYAPYVPGYDSHGLPIENAVLKDVKGGRAALTPVELRQKCRAFALSNLKGQEANFRRLGVWGDWENPYITLDQRFEAKQLRVFGKMAKKGYLYKGLKSVSWCPTCETALAEAEVEYADHTSNSIYVKFAVDGAHKDKLPQAVKDKDVAFVIWTTTPWTLPANLAIALHPEFNYQFLQVEGENQVLVVAESLKDAFLNAVGMGEKAVKVLANALGKELELMETRHPFVDRLSRVINGKHVTAEAGTGVVHTAPGHGPEDFEIGKEYNLGVLSPVDTRGIFTKEAGIFEGQRYNKANPAVVEHLKEVGALLHHSTFSHSYPHCWRCKNPLIFRATEQWFASVDGFRQSALESIDKVEWLPQSGRNRIFNMVQNRSDWCISRQRAWGVPIPVFYCKDCNEPLLTEESVESVAKVFETEGSDSWWDREPEYFLKGIKCVCGGNKFERETDIMDVWFDSGSTHATVLDERPELRGTPCELYLEGSDQHRGWFQSSLLTSVAVNGFAPYKTVLTHGFVVDENGRKMSKSVGNVVDPDDVIKQYGADVLRLWVASVNYTDDIPIGKNMLAQLAEVYRKLRNTARYMLGNLNDFDPATEMVKVEELSSLDRFVLHRLNELVSEVTKDFDRFEFFKYYQLLQNFCVVDLSSFYFDIVKDRLYCSHPGDKTRRAVQTVLTHTLQTLVRLLVPVTPHMAEDIWQHMTEAMREFGGNESSALLLDYPVVHKEFDDAEAKAYWSELLTIRLIVNKALEQVRGAKVIGSSLEASVVLVFEDAAKAASVAKLGVDLASVFITSDARALAQGESTDGAVSGEVLGTLSEGGLTVTVHKASGDMCVRCRKYTIEVGQNKDFVDLCNRCAEAMAKPVEALAGKG